MILSPLKILALSLGCSTSNGTGSLRIFSCFKMSPNAPSYPSASCSSPVFTPCHWNLSMPDPGQGMEHKPLFPLKMLCKKRFLTSGARSQFIRLRRESSWISLGWGWMSVTTEDSDPAARLTLPPGLRLFFTHLLTFLPLMKCNYFP